MTGVTYPYVALLLAWVGISERQRAFDLCRLNPVEEVQTADVVRRRPGARSRHPDVFSTNFTSLINGPSSLAAHQIAFQSADISVS